MDSSAHVTIDLPVGPAAALQVIERVIAGQKHKLHDSTPEQGLVRFVTKKTMLTWELNVEARITPIQGGSRIGVVLDTSPDRPKALLDGKKNQKAAQKLADQIRAAA